ncbi:chitin binding domain protein Peritrophin-A [Aspergillus nomiae NRRL 13137]|uniref:Chitin binding domain protein Peritrophin-A n=1 Tax=Aspergillus nomiae NRRL (strain ATCC 15546 / NRRL 13137 / CBS 260.88 / M93) TaxID=1509407 RepID=A0A0L1JBS3_ASPN3|nr:chitin binding domain protein Peritrophin-A [Aspergillus nomiae NRRL 13137]KNG88873.1 chitin binding domain protein Peritrophin-A [Aspergillus nomiae NRRL 13137]
MQFTAKALAIFAASLVALTASAHPSCETGARWPDQRDCHNFYECAAGGVPVRKTCGPGTAYDSRFSICDYEHKVPSCHGHGPVGHNEPHGHGEVKGHNNGEQEHGESKDQGKGRQEQGKGKQEEGHGKEQGNGEQEHGEENGQGKGQQENGEGNH